MRLVTISVLHVRTRQRKINLENLASAQTVDYFRNKFVEELYFFKD